MTLRLLVAFAFLLSVAGCGVKGDLEKPTAQTTQKEKDPSKPPAPIGR